MKLKSLTPEYSSEAPMKRLAIHVDTLGCEADESVVLDDLLAHDGVLAAEIDLARDTLSVAYDERKTTKSALLDHLRFFGIAPLGETLVRAA
jgi:copper chaperone CopZ